MKWCPRCKQFTTFSRNRRRADGLQTHCKDCMRTAKEAWRKDNPEKVRAQAAAWAAKNPEKIKSANSLWYSRNVEKARARDLLWSRANADHVRARNRAWCRNNLDKMRLKNGRRRAALAGRRCELTHEQWLEILEYFNYTCAYCLRANVPLGQDHVVAITSGGDHVAENVVPCCKPCNSRKRDLPVFLTVSFSGRLVDEVRR